MKAEKRREIIIRLISKKDKVIDDLLKETAHYIESHQDKSLKDLVTLLLFIKSCGEKPFLLKGEDCIGIENIKGNIYQEQLHPAKFIGFLERKLISYFDEDIRYYYSVMLKIPNDEDLLSIENLIKMKEHESLKIHYPDNNRLYGEIADRLLDKLDSVFWNETEDIMQIDKYAFVYELLCRLNVIEEDEGASDNEKQNKIKKYIDSYYSFIKKYH